MLLVGACWGGAERAGLLGAVFAALRRRHHHAAGQGRARGARRCGRGEAGVANAADALVRRAAGHRRCGGDGADLDPVLAARDAGRRGGAMRGRWRRT